MTCHTFKIGTQHHRLAVEIGKRIPTQVDTAKRETLLRSLFFFTVSFFRYE